MKILKGSTTLLPPPRCLIRSQRRRSRIRRSSHRGETGVPRNELQASGTRQEITKIHRKSARIFRPKETKTEAPPAARARRPQPTQKRTLQLENLKSKTENGSPEPGRGAADLPQRAGWRERGFAQDPNAFLQAQKQTFQNSTLKRKIKRGRGT